MDWPATIPDLEQRLRALPKDVLGLSIDTVYYLGHWLPAAGRKQYPYIQETGAYWKYQYWAQDAWRAQYPTINYPEYYNNMKPDFWTHLEGTEYSDDELTYKYQKLLKSDLLTVLRVDRVNYQPHPFMIGSQHFPKDGRMFIDPHQAPCAMRGCNLSYDEHTSDRALIVNVRRDCTGDELRTVLLPITAGLTADKINGVALSGAKVNTSENKLITVEKSEREHNESM